MAGIVTGPATANAVLEMHWEGKGEAAERVAREEILKYLDERIVSMPLHA
jgi:hypothetical protein